MGFLIDERTIEKFFRHVAISGDCWHWTASCNTRNGYGQFGIKDADGKWTMGRAHKVAYEILVGEVPAGLVLDHTCHTSDCAGGIQCPHRRCVNPDHLCPVPQRDNVLRSNAPTAINGRKTECVNGHPFTPDNLYTWSDSGGGVHRWCVECRRNQGRGSSSLQ